MHAYFRCSPSLQSVVQTSRENKLNMNEGNFIDFFCLILLVLDKLDLGGAGIVIKGGQTQAGTGEASSAKRK